VVRLCVAFEVLYYFLDALAEQPVQDMVANNRRLYGALAAALTPAEPLIDVYADHPQQDDSGYVQHLVETCRQALMRLPSHHDVAPALRRFAARAAEAQAFHHAAGALGELPLQAWAARLRPAASGLQWWEVAAAAGSPLGVFALAAAASRTTTSAKDAGAVEAAYFPWIAALSWLLESLVDAGEDAGTGAHSYVSHYETPAVTAARLGAIASRANGDVQQLPAGSRHVVLLAGMVSLYLSHEGADSPGSCQAAEAVRRAIGAPVGLLTRVLRLRRAV
jgi:tetraprenyl-beta-curcumene synthase